MAAMSAAVFALSWWLGLYLWARNLRKPVLALAALGLTSFALVVALDALRVGGLYPDQLNRVEVYLVVVPAIAWFGVLLEMSRSPDDRRSRVVEVAAVSIVAAAALTGAALAGTVSGPLRLGHWVMFSVVSISTLMAMGVALRRQRRPRRAWRAAIVATLFFALGNAILVIPLGLVPSWVALASTACDVVLLGVAVALWDAFDEGQALRADMLRSFVGSVVVGLVFGSKC
jgi:hypothetical protein